MSLVELTTAKEFLQIKHSEQDVVIQIMLDGAEEFIQRECGVYFYPSTAAEHTEDLSVQHRLGQGNLWPSKLPIISVTSIADRDDDDELVDAEDYRFDERKISMLDEGVFDQGWCRWRVKYCGGYTAATLLAGLKLEILNLVYRAYKVRGGQSGGGAAGASVNWSALLDSDMMQRLYKYRMGAQLVG